MKVIHMLAVLLAASCVAAQEASKNILKLTLMVQGMNGNPGAGIVIGEDSAKVFAVTAAHVVGKTGGRAVVKLHPQTRGPRLSGCIVLASTAETGDKYERPDPDLAVLACEKVVPGMHDFFYDVLGDPGELTRGSSLTLVGNFSVSGWDQPLGYFLFDKQAKREINFYNPLKVDLGGASGGPLLTDRSQLIGLTYVFGGPIETEAQALRWPFVEKWIREHASLPVRLATVAPSASALRRNSVELSASATSMFFPGFGWLSTAPKLRISAPLQNVPHVGVSFDFTFTQAEKNSESISVTVPSILGQLQIGSMWGPLRRRGMLGGIYVASGIAPVGLQRGFFDAGRQITSERFWMGIFDAGWRYRFPGRSWGFSATYREGLQINASPNALYPRFRAFDFGTFLVFK